MELSQQSFDELARLIHRLCGLVVGGNKHYLIRHRLEPVVRSSGLESFDELLHRLKSTSSQALHDAIIEAITTKETSFFRDPWLFDAILTRVLPELLAGHKRRIRIWSAGAATGQEAYSLGMLVRELVDSGAGDVSIDRFAILASDISTEALKTAQAASYTKADLARGISELRLRKHFHHRGSRWMIDDRVRNLVQFQRFNLLEMPATIGKFDLVMCRNVLIYFDESTRTRICRDLHRAMNPGGWLVLGSAESLYGIDEGFESIKCGRAVLYRKS